MPTRALARRVDGLLRAGAAGDVGRIVVLYPDDWPEEIRAAYDAAGGAGDQALQADLIERQPGECPVVPMRGRGPVHYVLPSAMIEIRMRLDGPC